MIKNYTKEGNIEMNTKENEIIQKRIMQNKKLFNKKELKIISENKGLIQKIYLLAILDHTAI